MKTCCIYIDESGNNPENAQFIYVAICVPFNSQQEFLKSYLKIVNPLVVRISGKEIKYGDVLNKPDMYYQPEIGQVCKDLLTHFSHIENAKIIRVKAIRKKMRHEGNQLRGALFKKTLELSKEFLPVEDQAMVLHDELNDRRLQGILLDRFNHWNKKLNLNFQNCVFVHSNENPFIQFADFVAAICYRYYYFQEKKYKDKGRCASLVDSLFKTIDERYPPIVELSDHKIVKGNVRRDQALKLAREYDIAPETAYRIVDEEITLNNALRRKSNRERRKLPSADEALPLGDLLRGKTDRESLKKTKIRAKIGHDCEFFYRLDNVLYCPCQFIDMTSF